MPRGAPQLMDVPLYAIALTVFAVLYLGIGVFLAYTLLITLIIMLAYLALRYGNVAENYPHSLPDTAITLIFIGVTWGIFTYLAPKNPIPFIGKGFLYTNATLVPLSAILVITFVLAFGFLTIFAFVANQLGQRQGGGGAPPGERPGQGIGAG